MSKTLLAAAIAAMAVSFAAPASAAVIVITQSKALAGNVTPGDTAGFPATLSTPGAYRLDTNLTVPSGAIGIQFRTHYVDLDMNGFRLYGWNAAGTQRLGTYGIDSAWGIGKIHDGFISGFRFDGIRLRENADGSSDQMVVEDMTIQSNGERGIGGFDSSYLRFLNNTITLNGSTGIDCGEYCHVEGNLIAENSGSGVSMWSGTALGNTIAGNVGFGIFDAADVADTGVGNNTLIRNSSGQLAATIDLQPNACIPSPC